MTCRWGPAALRYSCVLSDHGFPHVVVIDQAGKIRMVRVGSGEKNAKDIGDLLEQLSQTRAKRVVIDCAGLEILDPEEFRALDRVAVMLVADQPGG